MAARLSIIGCVFVGLVSVCSLRAAAAESGALQAPSGARILHFPAERSLGTLMVRPARPEESVDSLYYWLRDSDWDLLGPARGEVAVPAGCQVFLLIDIPQAWRDLSPLARLGADDLYSLRIQGPFAGSRPGNSCLPHVAHLTGLRVLSLMSTNVTGSGLRHIVRMKNLRQLALPDGMDDRGMEYVGQLPSLTALYLKENRVTNAGLKHLAKLPSLVELELGGGQIDNDGLVYLAELPQLRYLILWGKRFSDVGLAHLKDVEALEILNLGGLEQITDAGLAHLSCVPQLKDINLYWCKNITDAGLVPLKRLPNLRTLNLRHAQVTDEGLACLREVKTLEGLSLPGKGITDEGLKHLSELPRLRELSLPRPHYVDPNMDRGYYTDEGVRALSKLTSLEKLHLGSLGITDEGIRCLAGLDRLQSLSLFGCSRITDESFKTIAQLRSLERLSVKYGDLTVAGLKALNSLARLKNLDLDGVHQDNSGLDLSGLVNLEDLMLSLRRKRVAGEVVVEPFQERDFATLGKLTRLKRLQISHGGATDAALGHVTGLKRLERLSLGGEGLTDEGLVYLAALPHLSSLTLSGRFTDKALEPLQKLEHLGFLELKGAVLSQAAVSRFQRDMPKLGLFRGYEIDYTIRPGPPSRRGR